MLHVVTWTWADHADDLRVRAKTLVMVEGVVVMCDQERASNGRVVP